MATQGMGTGILCCTGMSTLFTWLWLSLKVVSSFMGRPPLLSRRYNLTALPLDLDDAELMSDQATLANAVSQLDANGWDTRGRMHDITLSRARMMLANVKNEIMEMVLGVPTEDTAQRAQ